MWSTEDGTPRAALHQKSYAPERWPPLRWTSDQKLCARGGNDELLLFDGAFPALNPTPLFRLPSPGIDAVYVSPAPAPLYSFLTFSPATKGRPGSASLWSLPNVTSPVVSRSMQADGCRVEWAPDGGSALVELTLAATADSYYGDSRAFLLTRGGGNIALEPPKEGSVHDFAWSPTSECFIVIAGKSPPAATLYNKTGVATFSFGAAAHNTIRFSPNGHVVLLAGFGNMGGAMTFWDVAKRKLISVPANAQCVVNSEWSPDSRFLLTATLRPRLQVDNGYRVWDYHGRCVAARDCDFLYDARWKTVAKGAFPPPRAPSPMPGGGGGGGGAASGGASASPPAGSGKYIPPSLRGVSGDARAAAATMNERYTPAGKIAPAAAGSGGGAGAPPLLVGQAPPQLSKGQLKKLKEKEKATKANLEAKDTAAAEKTLALMISGKTTASEGGGGGGWESGDDGIKGEAGKKHTGEVEGGGSSGSRTHAGLAGMLSEEEKEKTLKKLQRKLKDTLALKESLSKGVALDEQQMAKVQGLEDLEKRIAELSV